MRCSTIFHDEHFYIWTDSSQHRTTRAPMLKSKNRAVFFFLVICDWTRICVIFFTSWLKYAKISALSLQLTSFFISARRNKSVEVSCTQVWWGRFSFSAESVRLSLQLPLQNSSSVLGQRGVSQSVVWSSSYCVQLSISSTFYEQLFCMKVLCIDFF